MMRPFWSATVVGMGVLFAGIAVAKVLIHFGVV